jgi:hypothetical protein
LLRFSARSYEPESPEFPSYGWSLGALLNSLLDSPSNGTRRAFLCKAGVPGKMDSWAFCLLCVGDDKLPEKKKTDVSVSHQVDAYIQVDEEGVEQETVGFRDRITKPFDPNLISVSTQTFTIDLILARIRNKELNLDPDFQRHDGIWSEGAQSRLIESLLIRIPLPAFYMDATDEAHWLVVDGLQRLSTIRRFVIAKELRLSELEFLSELEGQTYDQLSRNMQRRILETQVTVYLIERDTQPEVKFNIFKRINTGGLPLSAQEIRHALNQGPATILLRSLAESEEFKRATSNGINPKRMGDRECVLRFFAFTFSPPEQYSSKDFDSFLNAAMNKLNSMPPEDINALKAYFTRAMNAAWKGFGAFAFRKRYSLNESKKYPINKALFEVWSVNLGKQTDENLLKLMERKKVLEGQFCNLMKSDYEFGNAISFGTGDSAKVRMRFREIEKIIGKVISDK